MHAIRRVQGMIDQKADLNLKLQTANSSMYFLFFVKLITSQCNVDKICFSWTWRRVAGIQVYVIIVDVRSFRHTPTERTSWTRCA